MRQIYHVGPRASNNWLCVATHRFAPMRTSLLLGENAYGAKQALELRRSGKSGADSGPLQDGQHRGEPEPSVITVRDLIFVGGHISGNRRTVFGGSRHPILDIAQSVKESRRDRVTRRGFQAAHQSLYFPGSKRRDWSFWPRLRERYGLAGVTEIMAT